MSEPTTTDTTETAAATGCLEEHPSHRTMFFAGSYINIAHVARASSVDRAYVSRILNGKKDTLSVPLRTVMKIAAALGLSIDELVEHIHARVEESERKRLAILQEHEDRLTREHKADLADIKAGRTPAPRLFDKM